MPTRNRMVLDRRRVLRGGEGRGGASADEDVKAPRRHRAVNKEAYNGKNLLQQTRLYQRKA